MDIDGQTRAVAILGDPVAHSLSPRMHNAAFAAVGLNWRYLPFRVGRGDLATALRGLAALGFAGCNITVPHKQAAAATMDAVDRAAQVIGAVNTVRVVDGRLEGFNTDAPGVVDALAGGTDAHGRQCVVIGAGGGARAAAFALAGGATRLVILNRTVAHARGLAQAVAAAHPSCAVDAGDLSADSIAAALDGADAVIHATSATMSAAMGGAGGREEWLATIAGHLRPGMAVLDMVYTPAWTDLLTAAQRAGATAISGLALLVYQGARSFEVWTGRPAPVDVMRKAVGL